MFSDLKHIYFCKDIEYYFKNQILFDFFNLDKKIFSFLTEVMKLAISKYGDSNMNDHYIIISSKEGWHTSVLLYSLINYDEHGE